MKNTKCMLLLEIGQILLYQVFHIELNQIKLSQFRFNQIRLKYPVKMTLNWIFYQVSKPEMKFRMIHIMYAALQTEKTTFSCKDDQGKSLYVSWSGARDLKNIKTVHGPSLHKLSCACFLNIFTATQSLYINYFILFQTILDPPP